jgi:RNA polymerase sigma-70 factor (sigma-E family)
VKRQDEDRYREYVTARMDGLRRWAYLVCHDWHAADDLVAVTLAKLYRSWARAQAVDSIDAYVRTIMLRSWLDEKRRPWRREHATDSVPDRPAEAEPEVLDRMSLLQLLAALTPRRRAAVVLRFYFDHSVEETAEILGCSPSTVRSLTARGLEAVRMRASLFGNGEPS